MESDLIQQREQVMNEADRVLDAAWPERTGAEYTRAMQSAAAALESIAAAMARRDINKTEQSRTYRYLGSVYSDLTPAVGAEMLLKAKEAYEKAEALLAGEPDELERAKLNFNFGNTLRQIDPSNAGLLQEAKRRLLAARACFAVHAPQYLPQVDAGLKSVEDLLALAPLAGEIAKDTEDMAALQEKLAAGGDVGEIVEETHKVMKRHGGPAGMVGRLQAIINTLSGEQRQSAKFAEVQKRMEALTRQVIGGNEMSPEIKEVWSLLNDRLKSEAESGNVSKERAETLKGVMEEYGRILSGDEKDVHSLLGKEEGMREFIRNMFETCHYLSHGIKRPPESSRASELVELSWQLRRYLLEEMNRPEKGEEESKEALDLTMRASRVDRRIYEAGSDETRAVSVERDELRPLALAIRSFSARMYTMPARPVWRSGKVPADTNAVFYSGAAKGKESIAAACGRSGLEVMAEPRGESYADARWKQIQKAVTAVFDLRGARGSGMASITYELGIALTLGKPAVVLVKEGQKMPFDVEIDPIILSGGPQDDAVAAAAVDKSVVWIHPAPSAGASSRTLEYILSMYRRPQKDVYADQTLRMLAELTKAPDPLAVTQTLMKFFDFLNDGETMLVHPWWPPVYPEEATRSLFHVMPFGPKWARSVSDVAREACKDAGVLYVRGDEVAEPDVVRSIWEQIARATHILVDLTGFNANVALELGVAHTLGKKVLMVGQGDPETCVFQSVSKFRVESYGPGKLDETLGRKVKRFVSLE